MKWGTSIIIGLLICIIGFSVAFINKQAKEIFDLKENLGAQIDSLTKLTQVDNFNFREIFPVLQPKVTELKKGDDFEALFFIAGGNNPIFGEPYIILADSITEDLKVIGPTDTIYADRWVGEMTIENCTIGSHRQYGLIRVPNTSYGSGYLDFMVWMDYEVKE